MGDVLADSTGLDYAMARYQQNGRSCRRTRTKPAEGRIAAELEPVMR